MVKRSRIVAFFLIVLLFAGLMGGTTNKILKHINLGLDLQGGFEVLYKVEPAKKGQKITSDVLKNTVEALDRRVNALGVNEPNIQIEGKDQIRVQLAGVKDQKEARDILATTANISFRDVNDKKLMDGTDLVEGKAKQSYTETGKPNVVLQVKDRKTFHDVTKKVLDMAPNNQLIIWLDFEEGKDSYKKEVTKKNPKFLSNPNVNEVFNTDTVTIEGNFTVEEAQNLASLLKAGALPVKLKETYSTSVGAQFGEHALNKTIDAGIIGVAIVFLFMLVYYRFPGLIAVVTLAIYIYLTLLVFQLIHGVLTLPGIAALILGVGMAVDANIITYERVKEELKVGRSVKAAFAAGNKSSFMTIFDANITTILAAVILFVYGSSSVKGFATLLIISILLSFVTAVYGTRLLLGLWVNSNIFKKRPGWFGVNKKDIHDITENMDAHKLSTHFDRFDFVKHHNKFFVFSIALTIIGIIALSVFRLNLSIDYTSGTRVEVLAKQSLTPSQLQSDLKTLKLTPEDVVLSGNKNEIGVMRFKGAFNKAEVAHITDYFTKKYGPTNVSTVSPTVGKELAKNAFISLILAAIGIIIYVAFRFEWRMGVAAVIALLHDAFLMVTFFSITRLEVDLTFIAAILTIIGYSINDTIVTFDRIRDHSRFQGRFKTAEDIAAVVNVGLRQTMTRSINTVLTVVITAAALFIFGSESIRNFSIALLVGLIMGCYSSIFIAAQLWYVFKKRELKKKGPIKTVKEKRKWSDEPQV
ncbi:protein translocase subunit SecDF [Heyndrickxia sporothermodurans]|uniref:protein translocase subunit SecDF n=1 Tax=Heyndrickxia sporothermodurans TaxID=46224 RepID=UPI002DBE060A|nr:protein translocase subunit SecDF [Heyndrickxia sporothermodurans]MEB6547976.1 protein translocase subunit SecDF [Heyndrickxia sporothermodurans]MED3649252.1 protein translocase subunit SecDF [Heyndrickxia sporothermodurans]MED3654570.1 protein translocase subunit SecDF [Heyndrickxia sporothermodurans]MED3696625.1 protein translocase subunit SecDF [Heyndrickxia sporothermodurans]